jgi:hypothetical protein
MFQVFCIVQILKKLAGIQLEVLFLNLRFYLVDENLISFLCLRVNERDIRRPSIKPSLDIDLNCRHAAMHV